jgi:hypothetical protein
MNNLHYKVEHKDDYNLIQFTKNDDIIKRIKAYAYRNCKKEINNNWISSSLKNTDVGFVYFHTEIIETIKNNKIVKETKYRPCAFICLIEYNNNEIHILLVCSIYTTGHLGTMLINEAIKYSQNKGYKIISLDSTNQKNTKYYEKKGFIIQPKVKELLDTTIYMTKTL